ncbi:shufflon system plasmid conjugative transfer pilus tip adhesin PilV [Enterobacter soli]|uniref:shufflon system plasmid conjugative transfer pilus tip adhesin PilV n=1 Tax=Enterobacter soli TaxID=885040 RepID=UPI002377D67E|nr:shufflon system plasmid conjugative transfer pilus tip adhesin PilV [Enterobacter soli]MDD9245345.1 shufflon system plasmid conjugative transfer pilus tip adhesin PilV [Enterobacter soli]
MFFQKNKNGFSLLELILVLGVGTMVAFMKFQDMKNEQESILASAVGQQMKQLGEAVNGYINIRYDKLSTLSNSTGTGTDPGPRTCSGSVCEITYQTLINEGLLPTAYTGINVKKSPYKILLKRDGTAPNYVINGMITTAMAWIEGGNTRYDLLGQAMQTAGIDSGMTRTTSNAFGYGGQWSETSANFNNITSAGQLAFRVGFNSALYSIYLRRDGTLPMTGNLNMGGQSIYNAQDITAAGTTTTGILKTNAAATVGTTLNVAGVTTLGSDLNVSGNGQINGNLNSNNTVSGTTITSRGETYTQNWFRTLGDGGIYFQKYGGGWNMGDTATINAYGGKNVQTTAGFYGGYVKSTGNIDANGTVNAAYVWASGNLNSNYIHSNGNIDADGRLNAGEFLYINGKANVGSGCSPNGLQATASNGLLLSCVSGKWVKASGTSGFFTMNRGVCLVKNPETNACSCQSGTIAKELFYTTSTEPLGGGSHGGGTTVVKDRILYQCR